MHQSAASLDGATRVSMIGPCSHSAALPSFATKSDVAWTSAPMEARRIPRPAISLELTDIRLGHRYPLTRFVLRWLQAPAVGSGGRIPAGLQVSVGAK